MASVNRVPSNTTPYEQDSHLLDLPDEILHNIFSLLDVTSLVSTQNTCRRFFDLDSPLLWRKHCISEYTYWHPTHNFSRILQQPAIVEQPWRGLLRERRTKDLRIRRTITEIIPTTVERLARLRSIVLDAEDAKDVLYDLLACPDDALDVLARRYWINEALGSIDRTRAIEEWAKLADNTDVPLERALGAFDLFCCERPPETLDQISAHLDMLADNFRADNPEHASLTLRERAIALVVWLRSIGFRGVEPDHYYELKNSLISVALCDASHSSIPIISVAIYSCIAQRIGIDAQPCGIPSHVLAIVRAPAGQTLDGEVTTDTKLDTTFLDPFTDSNEIPPAQLTQQLLGMGFPSSLVSSLHGVLKPLAVQGLLLRASANIANLRRHHNDPPTFTTVLTDVAPEALTFLQGGGHFIPTLQTTLYSSRALYATIWVQLVSTNDQAHRLEGDLGDHLESFAQAFQVDFQIDEPLATRYVLPILDRIGADVELFQTFLQRFVDEDASEPVPSPRLGVPDAARVRFRVGQIFRHRRFRYLAAITGWDPKCKASDQWMRQMNVDALEGGRTQCFYHVVVEDGSTRYVADENVVLEYSNSNGGYVDAPVPVPPGLEKLAGRWFKRWDQNRGRFISNVEEQYPDD